MLRKFSNFIVPSILLLPAVAVAQTDGINRLIDQVQILISRLVPVVIGLALLLFLFGVLRYLIGKNAEDKEAARNYMIWGIIALFVMVSVWGLVQILSDTIFGTSGPREITPSIPRVPGS
jgi:uncharacterized membrane protein YidH (DUF202 family)